ncbi:LLM class flavin-dependent oxidoreductase [Amycolatopsis jejuensis]|uniref:LLM class flavin-dependent oxidoreductase n=1 Tax=Amycolatopsis jejuensis TaxID=330084 RepID=UPI00052686F3|nr:LLM class flavin-dependent oxidoreductase [Amycolatopsis jejuensis]
MPDPAGKTPQTPRTPQIPKDPVFGFGFGRYIEASTAVRLAPEAEALGYHQLWVSNERFHRDMLVTLGAAAAVTATIELGTFVADPYTVHPLVTAAAVATLDELSGGRALLGLGAGGSGLPEMGLRRVRPLQTVAAALEVTRAFLRGETVSAQADVFAAEGARLAVKGSRAVPIVLASQSPRMLRLAGAVADQAMIASLALPGRFEEAAGRVRAGAVEAGREWRIDRDVVARIDCCVDDDPARARDAVRPLITQLLVGYYPRWEFLGEARGQMPPELEAFAAAKDYPRMLAASAAIPDAVLDAVSWTGPPETVAKRVLELAATGVRRFVILPHALDRDIAPTMRAFADRVIPLVRDGLVT